MIKQKTGICIDCNTGIIVPVVANRCQSHYWQHREKINEKKNVGKEKKVQKPIPKFSEKRKKENLQYISDRIIFLGKPENKICFIEGCNSKADTIEHRAGRIGKNYLDQSTWAGCCNFHNLELERNPELSQKYQISKISGKQKIKK